MCWWVVRMTVAGQNGGMNDRDLRVLGLSALDLMDGSYSDDEVAGTFGDLDAVAAGAVYLTGFAVQALAAERQESVPATVDYLRGLLGKSGGHGEGTAGVREPRRPRPSPGGLAAEADRGG